MTRGVACRPFQRKCLYALSVRYPANGKALKLRYCPLQVEQDYCEFVGDLLCIVEGDKLVRAQALFLGGAVTGTSLGCVVWRESHLSRLVLQLKGTHPHPTSLVSLTDLDRLCCLLLLSCLHRSYSPHHRHCYLRPLTPLCRGHPTLPLHHLNATPRLLALVYPLDTNSHYHC